MRLQPRQQHISFASLLLGLNINLQANQCISPDLTLDYVVTSCREQVEDKQEDIRNSYKGKQFLPSCAKSGRTPDTYFGLDKGKKHLYLSEVCMVG